MAADQVLTTHAGHTAGLLELRRSLQVRGLLQALVVVCPGLALAVAVAASVCCLEVRCSQCLVPVLVPVPASAQVMARTRQLVSVGGESQE